MRERVGQVRDVRAGLGVDLAALQAVAAVDAVRTVAERPVDDPDRADPHLDPAAPGALAQHGGSPGHRVRGVRVAVRIAPRPVLPGHRQLPLHLRVVRTQVRVGDRPVRADAVPALRGEVRRVEAGRVAGVVHHRPADAPAGVVLAQLDRVRAADDPLLGPVEVVAAGLVGHPVLVRVPERAGLQDHDPPAVPGQPLGEHGPAGTGADDHQVDLVVVVEPAHRRLAGQVAAMHVEQVAGVVVPRPDRTLQQPAQELTLDGHASPGPPRTPPAARTARGRPPRSPRDRPGA